MWHSCNEIVHVRQTEHWATLDYTVSKGTTIKVNRQDKFDGLYAMGSLGGVLGLCSGKYLCKVKLENYNSSELGLSVYNSTLDFTLGTLEYIGGSREILEVYDIESIVDQIIQDYSYVEPGTMINKYMLLRKIIWLEIIPNGNIFEFVQKYFKHLIEQDQEVY